MKNLIIADYPTGNCKGFQKEVTDNSFMKIMATGVFKSSWTRSVISVLLILMMQTALQAQEVIKMPVKKYMQVTTVESVVAGGLGRSKMIITQADGTQKEQELENLFSMVGINFKNIRQNDEKILRTLKEYTDNGWKLEQSIPLTLSQNDSGAGGIFMTRYLLSRTD